MCKILLSINPQHVENIFNGSKKYEYRKIKCKNKVDKIIIYSTYPVKKVVGEADVEEVIEDVPDKLWNRTKKYSGIKYDFFKKYYKDREKGIAYKLTNIKKYETYRDLDYYGVNVAPQSFIYLENMIVNG